MSDHILALLIGIIAGLRALMPLAAVSWAARLGRLPLNGTWLAFFGYAATPYITSFLAAFELFNDKRPTTPSRKIPPQFITRIVTGALSGAALTTPASGPVGGLIAGAIGAVIGTLGGAAMRATLAKSFGKDLPAALLEDAIALAGAFLVAFSV